jgi:hypothetical protein
MLSIVRPFEEQYLSRLMAHPMTAHIRAHENAKKQPRISRIYLILKTPRISRISLFF